MRRRPALLTSVLFALVPGLSNNAASAQDSSSLDAFGLLVTAQSRPSFSIIGAGARAAGMGGAFTALADDASAASFNPAGLALLLRPEAALVLDGIGERNDHAAFTNLEGGVLENYEASSSRYDTQGLNFAAFTYPFEAANRNLTLQLSYHRLIDFGFEGDRSFAEHFGGGDPIARIDQSVRQHGEVFTLSLSAAYQITPRTSLGLTLSRWNGGWNFSTSTAETILASGEFTSLRFDQANSWGGWNFTTGVLLRYRYLNVGLAYRSPFDGDFRVDSSLGTSFDSPFPSDSGFRGTLRWPKSISVGVAIKPTQTWFITADLTSFDWDDMVILGLGDEPINFFDLKPASTSTTRKADQWRFGSELTLFPGDSVVGLRAGYFAVPRPQLLAAGGEENSLRGWSVGVGWKRGRVSVDLAFQRGTTQTAVLEFLDPDTIVSGVVEAQAEGLVRTTEERVFLSVLYQFDSRQALTKVLRFLFVGPADEVEESSADE